MSLFSLALAKLPCISGSSVQIYVSASRVSVSWQSLLEDVITIKANGAKTAEDVAIRLNTQSLLLLTWNICVAKQIHSFK